MACEKFKICKNPIFDKNGRYEVLALSGRYVHFVAFFVFLYQYYVYTLGIRVKNWLDKNRKTKCQANYLGSKLKKNGTMLSMCDFYYLITVFGRYLLFRITVRKLFSLRNSELNPKMCCKNFENRLTLEKVLLKSNFEKGFFVENKSWKGGNYFPQNLKTHKYIITISENHHKMSQNTYINSLCSRQEYCIKWKFMIMDYLPCKFPIKIHFGHKISIC